MSDARNLGKNIFIYGLGTLAQRAVTFFLLPLYTNSLSVSEYGLLETVTVTSQILIFVMDIGMGRSVLRYYSRYSDRPEKLGKLISTALILMLLSGIFFFSVSLLIQVPLSTIILGESQFSTVLVWTVVSSMLQTFNQWVLILFRAKQQSGRYVLVSTINFLALISINVLFVGVLGLGVLGVLFAQSIVYLVVTLLFIPDTIKMLGRQFGFSIPMARQLFNFGFPLIFTTAGMLVMNSFDRYFLLHSWGLEAVGIYSFGVRIAGILRVIIVAPFQLAWAPFLFDNEDRDLSQLSSRFFTYLLLVLALGTIFLLFFSREIILVLSSDKFLETQSILPSLSASITFLAIFYWAGGFVNLVEQTWKLGGIVTFAGISNIVLNAFLTPRFGWVGAAWSAVLAQGIAASLTFFLAMRIYPVKFERERLVGIGIFSVGVASVYYIVLFPLLGLLATGLKIATLMLGLLILFVPMRFITQQEWRSLRNLYLVWKARVS